MSDLVAPEKKRLKREEQNANSLQQQQQTPPPSTSGHEPKCNSDIALEYTKELILPLASQWKRYTTVEGREGGPPRVVDLLDVLDIKPSYVQMSEFLSTIQIDSEIDFKEITNPAWRNDKFKAAEKTLSLLLKVLLDFDIKEESDDAGRDRDRPHRPFNAYPDVSMGNKMRVLTALAQNMKNLDDFEGKPESQRKFSSWPGEIREQYVHAKQFVREVLKFLTCQKFATEDAIHELFTIFCRVAGLHFSRGRQLEDSTFTSMGVQVTSRPDLRDFSISVREFLEAPPGCFFPNYKTSVVVKVSSDIPSKNKMDSCRTSTGTREGESSSPEYMEAMTHAEDVIGQLLAEMLAEMDHAKFDNHMFGICVQGSRVQLVHLYLNDSVAHYIFSDECDRGFRRQIENSPGKLYISETRDFMKAEDREKLWKILGDIGVLCASH